jgi:hypothetical protein
MLTLLFLPEPLAAVVSELGPRAVSSLRMIAAILLVTVLCGLVYVLRNLRGLKAEPGPNAKSPPLRTNHVMIFLLCAAVFAAACVLLFLVAKAGSPT